MDHLVGVWEGGCVGVLVCWCVGMLVCGCVGVRRYGGMGESVLLKSGGAGGYKVGLLFWLLGN